MLRRFHSRNDVGQIKSLPSYLPSSKVQVVTMLRVVHMKYRDKNIIPLLENLFPDNETAHSRDTYFSATFLSL